MALFFQIPNSPLASKRKIRLTPRIWVRFSKSPHPAAKPTLGSFLKIPRTLPKLASKRKNLLPRHPHAQNWVRSSKSRPHHIGFEAQKRPSPAIPLAPHRPPHSPEFDTPSPSSVTLVDSSPSKRENKSVHAYSNSVQACDRAFLARD